jgi:hypothetical protein
MLSLKAFGICLMYRKNDKYSESLTVLNAIIHKAELNSPDLFEHYILIKAMLLYLRMHLEGAHFIAALPIGRPNRYIRNWINPTQNERTQCYLDRLQDFLSIDVAPY